MKPIRILSKCGEVSESQQAESDDRNADVLGFISSCRENDELAGLPFSSWR